MNIGRIEGYACDGAIYCVSCMRKSPARFSACDAEGAEFDGGAGWHNCGAIASDHSPCHVIATEGEEPYPIHSGDLEDREACGGCASYYDTAWGGWLAHEPAPAAEVS